MITNNEVIIYNMKETEEANYVKRMSNEIIYLRILK